MMAASPRFKVYSADNEYVGCVKTLELAGSLLCVLGHGSTVRDGHSKKSILYTEGVDGDCADGYDAAYWHVEEQKGKDTA